MKNILAFITIILLFSSCDEEHAPQRKSSNLTLRQLVNSSDTIKETQGRFFLVGGSINSSESIKNTIKMYAFVDSSYKYLEYDVSKIRIKIDNNVNQPYLVIYYSSGRKLSDEFLTNQSDWYYDKIILYTHEKYLPEYLLPINIK